MIERMRVDIRRRRNPLRFLVPLVFIVVAGITVAFLASGKMSDMFKRGKITCAEGVELAVCESEEKFRVDYKITSEVSEKKTELTHEVLVPVTDFYDERQSISQEEFAGLKENTDKAGLKLLKFSELSAGVKMLAVDDKYYLDDFESGAYFENYTVEADGVAEDEEIKEIIEKVKGEITELPEKENVLTVNQTGVTALSRVMQSYMQQNGVSGAFFAEKIKDFLASTDITHLSNEVSFASDCTTNSASAVLCSPWEMYEVITEVGADVIELTGNHNNDWGKEANLKTIERYKTDGLMTFGGGMNEETAAEPLEISVKGTEIEWIGVNYSTSTKANGQGADGENPGANIYNEAETRSRITDAKTAGKYIIVDVQFAECYSYPDDGAEMPSCDAPIAGQEEFFRGLIDMGADMVVGTQAHQPQTYELYQGKPIYYGLGNLFFDQISWPGTTRGIILTHYFYKGQLLQTRLNPTQYGSSFQPELMAKEQAQTFLKRLIQSSPEGK